LFTVFICSGLLAYLSGREKHLYFCPNEAKHSEKHQRMLSIKQNRIVQGGQKSKPLPNYQKIVLNRIKACQ